MRLFFLFFFLISLASCKNILPMQEESDKIIAQIGDAKLYKKDLKKLLPSNLKKEDSVLYTRNLINSWAKQELFYQKATLNLSDDLDEINKLVKKYKQDLLINKYKEALIKKNLDTTITNKDLKSFYNENKTIFKLNEKLIQFRFLQVDKNLNDLETITTLFDSNDPKHLDSLHGKELEFKAYHLQDSTWVKFNNVSKRIKTFNKIDVKRVKNKLIKIEDSKDVYLFKIFNVIDRNDIAPINYVKPTIKQMILHNRKLKEHKKIEKTLLNDAIKNGKFKIYE
jgi:hypothetical protein